MRFVFFDLWFCGCVVDVKVCGYDCGVLCDDDFGVFFVFFFSLCLSCLMCLLCLWSLICNLSVNMCVCLCLICLFLSVSLVFMWLMLFVDVLIVDCCFCVVVVVLLVRYDYVIVLWSVNEVVEMSEINCYYDFLDWFWRSRDWMGDVCVVCDWCYVMWLVMWLNVVMEWMCIEDLMWRLFDVVIRRRAFLKCFRAASILFLINKLICVWWEMKCVCECYWLMILCCYIWLVCSS